MERNSPDELGVNPTDEQLSKNIKRLQDKSQDKKSKSKDKTPTKYVDPKWEWKPNHPDNTKFWKSISDK